MGSEIEEQHEIKRKKFRSKKIIKFDKKTVARKILAKRKSQLMKKNDNTKPNLVRVKNNQSAVKTQKQKTDATNGSSKGSIDEASDKFEKKRKKPIVEETEKQEDDEEANSNKLDQKKEESIRALKRKKCAELLQDKKVKPDVALQERSLNYLSKWKLNRTEWKFEKLRQIWLLQNMYDSSKVPSEFWDMLVEYFGNSKGKAKDVILKEAVKIIEDENPEDEEKNVKVERARHIIQSLQEYIFVIIKNKQ